MRNNLERIYKCTQINVAEVEQASYVKLSNIRFDMNYAVIEGKFFLSNVSMMSIQSFFMKINNVIIDFKDEDLIEAFEEKGRSVVSFSIRVQFPEYYQYIKLGVILTGGEILKPQIKYFKKCPNYITQNDMLLWTENDLIYCDHFFGDYGQALAIRYLRELICMGKENELYDFLKLPVNQTLSMEVFMNYVNAIIIYQELYYPEKTEIPLDIARAVISFLNHAFAKAVDLMKDYSPEIPDYSEEWETISYLLSGIEDAVILEHNTTRYMKAFLMSIKYREYCSFTKDSTSNSLIMKYKDSELFSLSTFEVVVFLLKKKEKTILVEGGFHLPAGMNIEKIAPVVLIDEQELNAEIISDMNDKYRFDRIYQHELGFSIELPEEFRYGEIRFGYRIDNSLVLPNKYLYQNLICPVSTEFKDSFAYDKDIMIIPHSTGLNISRCTVSSIFLRENLLQQRIQEDQNTSDKVKEESIFLREFYLISRIEYKQDLFNDLQQRHEKMRGNVKDFEEIETIIDRYAADNAKGRKKKVWLVMDRPNRADDNGEALFRYLVNNNLENVDVYFLLQKTAGGYDEISKMGNVIEPLSLSHCMLHSIASVVITSQMQEFAMNPFNERYLFVRDLCKKPEFVFLQHGVIHNHHGKAMGKYGRDFRGFITSAKPEYEYIKSSHFHYNEEEVWLTGLARFDRLYRDEKKIITVIPTWRKWLTHRGYDEQINTLSWLINDGFKDTKYFQFYENLINNQRLLEAVRSNGYKLAFLPHVNFLHLAEMFDHPDDVIVYNYEHSYRKTFAESSLLVTDYTSAVFDFAYLRKPIIYCQFDKTEFYELQNNRGYFDFEQDGFGEVVYDLEAAVDTIISYIKNDCKLKEKYKKRINAFFEYNDDKCCERITEHIKRV